MTIQVRYPKVITQEENSSKSEWNDLDNVKIDDWDELASTVVESNEAPQVLCTSHFDFNIPDDARVSEVIVEHDFHKDSSENPIKMDPPMIKAVIGDSEFEKESFVHADVYPADRSVKIIVDDIEGKDINNNFTIKVEFPKNTSENNGVLYFDYIRVKLVFEVKRYLITSGETNNYFPTKEKPIKIAVGEELRYSIYFRNVNGISKEPQEVKINIPEGFELVKYYFKPRKVNKLSEKDVEVAEDIFDEKNYIWTPSARGKGMSGLRLILKATREGFTHINAYTKNYGATPNFYVEVHPEGFESPANMFDETSGVWASELEDNEEFQRLNQEVAIDVDKASMEFDMPQEKVDNLKEYCIKWVKRELKPKTNFKALNDLSFTINKGERVGIIGFNGAGKSTLLKVLSGVFKPTKGKIYTAGKIAPLLELGAGFDHNYSGRENVFLNGAILGYSKEFLLSKYDEIVEFSELGDFMEIPIKNYSSGMVAKLGFSVATVVEPDILILDEILSVGDVKFQKKSGDKLKSMMGSGVTVLLVSHSTAKIRELCTRAIWLDKGKLIMDGNVDYVCDAYIEAAKKASADEIKDLELV